jgi:malonate-semialdehyde dehydrogenase (acetylating)/methylmalonate-semialdehyde dehydrogenase
MNAQLSVKVSETCIKLFKSNGVVPVTPAVTTAATGVASLNFIGGAWIDGEQGVQTIFSPQTGLAVGEYSIPGKTQILEAVAIADRAQRGWGTLPAKDRAKVLFNARQILLRDADAISNLKAAESGKTPEEARAGLMKGIEVLEFALAIQNLDLGGRLEVSRGVSCEYRREALGVVVGITPFNFPAMVPMWMLPIAIAIGNAFVWKPSEKTPLTPWMIANAFKEAGLPDGILTVLHGGGETVETLIADEKVKAVGFVGSTKIAKLVYTNSALAGKRALALGGAKNHIVLLPDANADLAGPGISDSFTGCAGQRCMAAAVLLAVGGVDKHIEKIVKRASSLALGTQLGAIITREQVEFLNGAIERAVKGGARLLLDGRSVKPPPGLESGNWLGPTILDQVQPGSEAAKLELFGPVLTIIRCRDLSEAMKIENSVGYGNACSVFTSSGVLADRVVREASTGMVGVNVGVPVPREPFSFGGINLSKFGHGDITGHQSLDFWSNVKKITVKWEVQTGSDWMS